MSVKAMAAVWERSNHKGSNLLVMLALADWGDDNGQNIYPAVETIAFKTRLGVRAVRYILSELEESGEITIERNARQNRNGQWTNTYKLNLPAQRGAKIAGVQNRARKGCKVLPKGVNPVASNPSGTTIEPSPQAQAPAVSRKGIPSSKHPALMILCDVLGITYLDFTDLQKTEIANHVGDDTGRLSVFKDTVKEYAMNHERIDYKRFAWILSNFDKALLPKPQVASRNGHKPPLNEPAGFAAIREAMLDPKYQEK